MRPSSLQPGATARNALVTSRPLTVTLTAGGAEGAEAPVISMSASPPLTMSGRLDTTRMSTLPCANGPPPAGTKVRAATTHAPGIHVRRCISDSLHQPPAKHTSAVNEFAKKTLE